MKIETKQEFIDFIKPFGWSVQVSNNGLNDRLVTPTGNVTDIRVSENHLEPCSAQLFGDVSFEMFVYWYYNKITHNEKEKFISVDGLVLMY